MAEFTKEQLIKQAQKNITVLRGAVEKIPGNSEAAVIHLRLAEIALAALTAEPVAYISDSNLRALERGVVSVYVKNKPVLVRPSALYRLPLLEGLK